MKPWIIVLTCIASVANFLLFILWTSVARLHAVGPDGAPTNTYDAISLQITILGIVVAAVAIGLAVAGVFGYQGLQAVVLRRADELVNARLNQSDGDTATGADRAEVAPPPANEVEEETAKL